MREESPAHDSLDAADARRQQRKEVLPSAHLRLSTALPRHMPLHRPVLLRRNVANVLYRAEIFGHGVHGGTGGVEGDADALRGRAVPVHPQGAGVAQRHAAQRDMCVGQRAVRRRVGAVQAALQHPGDP